MRFELPEISIQVRQDVDLKDSEDKDATAIRDGEIAVYDIAIIEPRTDENWDNPEEWEFLDSCGNYYGPPGHDNVYSDPRKIGDETLRFYATDMWAYRIGIGPGDLIRHQGVMHAVLGLECEPYEMDTVGYATGFLICLPTHGGRPARMWPGDPVHQVLEIGK